MIAPNIYVDKFTIRPKSQDIKYAYFLTHWHSDHYQGITQGWSYGPIICSNITKKIMLTKFPKLKDKVQGLQLNIWYQYDGKTGVCTQIKNQEKIQKLQFQDQNNINQKYNQNELNISTQEIQSSKSKSNNQQKQQKQERELRKQKSLSNPLKGKVDIMLFDANHIAGSVMYLFINKQINKTYFHTGDMRFNMSVVKNTPFLYQKISQQQLLELTGKQSLSGYKSKFKIDQLYLDNTYCDPIFDFPARSKALKLLTDVIFLNIDKRIFLCTDSIGKQQAFVLLAQKYKTSVILNKERYQYCQAMGIIRPLKCSNYKDTNTQIINFSLNPKDGFIQVIKKSQKQQKLKQYPNSIAITMTGWANINDYQQTGFNQYIVPYSLHSNFKELQLFMDIFKPKIMIPIVHQKPGKSQKFKDKIGSYQSYMYGLSYMKQRGVQYFQLEYCGK